MNREHDNHGRLEGRDGPGLRAAFLGYAESDDFIHSTYPRMLLAPDAEDTHWTEFYGMAAALIGHRRIGLLWIHHNHPEHSVMTSELVYSRHGVNYVPVIPRHEFLPPRPGRRHRQMKGLAHTAA